MNRQDIIDKMNPSEKEIFEKYQDTYPFPIRKFIEEIGIKIKYDDDPVNLAKMAQESDGKFTMILSNHDNKPKNSEMIEDMSLLTQLLYHIFTRDDSRYKEYTYEMKKPTEDVKISLCEFLMPLEVFKRQASKPNTGIKKLSKYFGVPLGIIRFYIEYLKAKTIGLDPYINSNDNIKYH